MVAPAPLAVPGGQGAHTAAVAPPAALLKVPALQGVADALPAPHQPPGVQGVHTALEVAPVAADSFPAGQGVQAALPRSGA